MSVLSASLAWRSTAILLPASLLSLAGSGKLIIERVQRIERRLHCGKLGVASGGLLAARCQVGDFLFQRMLFGEQARAFVVDQPLDLAFLDLALRHPCQRAVERVVFLAGLLQRSIAFLDDGASGDDQFVLGDALAIGCRLAFGVADVTLGAHDARIEVFQLAGLEVEYVLLLTQTAQRLLGLFQRRCQTRRLSLRRQQLALVAWLVAKLGVDSLDLACQQAALRFA